MSVVEKSGEGARFQEAELPIDIEYTKLSEWLVDRKKVPADWRKRVGALQSRSTKLLPSLPKDLDPEISSLTAETVRFLECRTIRDALAKSNPEQKTLFGGLAGLAGEWDALVRGYEKDQVFLGEASQILLHNCTYEIPFWRKQVARVQQQLSDLDRKETETRRSAAASAEKFKQSCADLGIKGINVRQELRELSHDLPRIFGQVSELLRNEKIGEALQCYHDFVTLVHSREGEEGQEPQENKLQVLPHLSSFRSRPNEATAAVAQPPGSSFSDSDPVGQPAAAAAASPAAAPGEINWDLDAVDLGSSATDHGAIGGGGAPLEISWDIVGEDGAETGAADGGKGSPKAGEGDAPVGISWDVGEGEGIATAASEAAPVSISWDIDAADAPVADPAGADSAGSAAALDLPAGIDWGIDLSQAADAAAEVACATEGIQISWDVWEEDLVAGSPSIENSAQPAALTELGGQSDVLLDPGVALLLSGKERNLLLDDLFELHAFLRQRLVESRRASSSSLLFPSDSSSNSSLQSPEAMLRLDEEISAALDMLTCQRTRDLVLLRSSPKFVDRLAGSLLQKKGSEQRLRDTIASLEDKRRGLRNSLASTWPKEAAAVARTKAFKSLVESTLSTQYNGRPVNVIGEINNIL